MKKSDIIFLISLCAYSILFWDHNPGLNFLIFNCVLVGGLLLRDKSLLSNRPWLVSAAGAIITGACIFWHCTALSIVANIIALLMTSSFVVHKGNSFFMAMIMAGLNTIGSCAFIILEFVHRVSRPKDETTPARYKSKRIALVVCAIAVAFIFFLLYRGSSVVFASFTNQINLDFISVGWCMFMVFGSLLLFSFYKQFNMEPVAGLDRNRSVLLRPSDRNGLLDKLMSPGSEYFAGIVLFGILNVMLLLVNILDVAFLFSGSAFLPDDISYSEYVHQGIQALILSILFATGLILFWFRNFQEKVKESATLKWLALLWVIQNIVMIVITIHRNHSYIFVYGLTYKRIGVDFYLFLALVGLILVIRKVLKQESNMQFLHHFGWTCFVTLILACPVNWDRMVFQYNIAMNRAVDYEYLGSLSDRLLIDQQLYAIEHENKYYRKADLNQETYNFMREQRERIENRDWQALCMSDWSAYNELMALDHVVSDTLLTVGYWGSGKLYYFPCFRHMKKMRVLRGSETDIGELHLYTELEWLDLSYSYELKSINSLSSCRQLRYLDLRQTGVTDYDVLFTLPNLKTLYVTDMPEQTRAELIIHNPSLEIIMQ